MATKGVKFTDEHKRNISLSLRGYKHSEEHKRKISEAGKGKKHSEETKRKMSAAQKGRKHAPLSEEHKKKRSEINKELGLIRNINNNWSWNGKKHTKETKKKMSEMGKGKNTWSKGRKLPPFSEEHKRKLAESQKRRLRIIENHPNWKGGKSFESYTIDWTKTLRQSIRERDKYICQICGKTQGDEAHSCHHIDYCKTNNNPDNLITLCRNCHIKTNYNRKYWEKFFTLLGQMVVIEGEGVGKKE